MISRVEAAAVSSLLVFSLAACSSDPLAEQFRSGDNKNYIAGDGSVTEFVKEPLPGPVSWGGTSESGERIESSQLEGVVVVLNFWYAGCAPCRAEAPDLVALADEFADSKVQFIGVNVRDSAETALAFDERFGVNYPSIIDSGSGAVSLAFTGIVSPQAVPTTLVIGADGKVLARILGRIDASILRTLIKSAVERG